MKISNPVLLVEDNRVDEITAERVLKNLDVRNLMVHNTNSGFEFGGYAMGTRALLLNTVIFLSVTSYGLAEQQDPNKQKNFFEMSLEELMDVPVVVSAARQPQKVDELSVPVSVITAEDIHYSGLTNIPEVLQFTPGMDVLKFNRFSYAVGVRGLHELSSDQVQSLVNGRLMDNPIYGGPEFWNLPVLLEDIDRIEIVRGPGGPAWGANAFTGVINVITKKPEDVLGWFSSSTVTEFGDTYTHLRWAEKQGKWRWRMSVGYEDNKSSDDALNGGASYKSFTGNPFVDSWMGFNNFEVRDFSRNLRSDTETIYRASDMTEVSFGTGYSHFESGDFEQMGYFPMEDIRSELVRLFAKIDHKFENGSTGYLQWFGNFQDSDRPNYFHYFTSENGLDGQLNFTPAAGHQASIGGNFRWTHISTSRGKPEEYVLPDEPYDEYWTGLFAIDRWQTTDRLTLEGQIRGDWYSETQTDWAGRLTALYGLDEKKEHILRISAARAFRTPLIALRRITVQRLPIPFDGYAVNLLPGGNLDNEQTWSLEAGYTGKLADGLTFRADTYYQRFESLIGGGMVAPTYYRMDNIDGGTSYGAECELSIIRKQGKLSAWYAYNDFETDQSGQFVRGMRPAKHKAGLTGRLFLPDKWTFNANYKFTDTTPASASVPNDVVSSNRLDLTVSKEIAAGKGEFMLGVSDVLDESHDPFIQCDTFTAHETPGRTFFVRMQLKF